VRLRLAGALVLLAASCVFAAPAAAQTVSPPPGPPSGEEGVLTRYRFHLDAEHLASNDTRFVWDADFGGDLDLVDYGKGRITALANYEAILGSQFRNFDPNQGNYTLDVAASFRFGANEVFGVLHHISRHLSDRAKSFPVDWNMAGVRFMRHTTRGRLEMTMEGRALGVLKRSYVDYTAEIGGGLDVSLAVNPHARIIGHGDAYGMLVEQGSPRKAQHGGRVEGGLRLLGTHGAVDLYLGYERRVDAYPLDVVPQTWFVAGFRLLSR